MTYNIAYFDDTGKSSNGASLSLRVTGASSMCTKPDSASSFRSLVHKRQKFLSTITILPMQLDISLNVQFLSYSTFKAATGNRVFYTIVLEFDPWFFRVRHLHYGNLKTANRECSQNFNQRYEKILSKLAENFLITMLIECYFQILHFNQGSVILKAHHLALNSCPLMSKATVFLLAVTCPSFTLILLLVVVVLVVVQ